MKLRVVESNPLFRCLTKERLQAFANRGQIEVIALLVRSKLSI